MTRYRLLLENWAWPGGVRPTGGLLAAQEMETALLRLETVQERQTLDVAALAARALERLTQPLRRRRDALPWYVHFLLRRAQPQRQIFDLLVCVRRS